MLTVLSVNGKAEAVKAAGCRGFVVPLGNEKDVVNNNKEKDNTIHPVGDLMDLLEVGFEESKPIPLEEGGLPLDDGCGLGRCDSVVILTIKTTNVDDIKALLLPVECAIYPGVGDLLITGQVSE